jgi:type IV fimbrial biogenesis protein FimT
MKARARGFSIIEMLIVIGVMAMLLAIGVPSFQNWLQNLQIRTAAESIVSGLQIAKNEAIRRNVNVTYTMELTTGSTNWKINTADNADLDPPLQQRAAEEGSTNVTAALLPDGAFRVTFSGLGRVTSNLDRSDPLAQIDLDNLKITNPSDRRLLRIVIPPGGAVRLCDKQVLAPDPRACP